MLRRRTRRARVLLRYRREDEPRMARSADDARGTTTAGAPHFTLDRARPLSYTVRAWVDRFLSWRHDFKRRVDAADIASAARVGGKLIAEAASRARREDAARLRAWAKRLGAATDTAATLKRVALDEDARSARRPLSRPRASQPYTSRAAGRRSIRARARFSALVRALPALGAARPGTPRHLRGRARRACPTCARWASTCCTCRRSIRSAGPSARARTTRWTPRRATSAAPGRSARTRAGTRRSIRSSARSRTSAPGRDGARHGHRDRARHRVPVRARPSVRERASGVVHAGGPTAPSSTPRTRRRSTRTSILSTSRAKTGTALWEELKSVFEFWIDAGRARSSASTTRTPSPSRSGNG